MVQFSESEIKITVHVCHPIAIMSYLTFDELHQNIFSKTWNVQS
jgi:hypothetical protein